MNSSEGFLVGCPNCQNEFLFLYGRSLSARKHYFCLICGRPYQPNPFLKKEMGTPSCPACGKQMLFNQKGKGYRRYRCSAYPACKQFLKINQ